MVKIETTLPTMHFVFSLYSYQHPIDLILDVGYSTKSPCIRWDNGSKTQAMCPLFEKPERSHLVLFCFGEIGVGGGREVRGIFLLSVPSVDKGAGLCQVG